MVSEYSNDDICFLKNWQRKYVSQPSEIASFTIELNKFLIKRFGYKLPPVSFSEQGRNATLHTNMKLFGLYLRFFGLDKRLWPENTLVIANIEFYEERAGHGTALVKFLLNHAHAFNYQYVGIEVANDNSSAFAKSIGLKKIEDSRNYVGAIEQINSAIKGD